MPRKKVTNVDLMNRVLKQQRRAQETAAKLAEARRKKTTRMKIILGGIHFSASKKLGNWHATDYLLNWVEKQGVDVSSARTALKEYLKETEMLEALRHGARPEQPQPEERKKPPQPAATTPPQVTQNDNSDTWVTV